MAETRSYTEWSGYCPPVNCGLWTLLIASTHVQPRGSLLVVSSDRLSGLYAKLPVTGPIFGNHQIIESILTNPSYIGIPQTNHRYNDNSMKI